MTNLIASLPLQVLCQLISTRAPHSNDMNMAGPNSPATVIQSSSSIQAATLPDGYIAYPEIGAAYKIHFDEVTWTEARERCNVVPGARLAIVDTERKLEYVWNATYYTHSRTDSSLEIYIGIYRMESKWVGVGTGLTLSHLPWYSGYPTTSNKDCVGLDLVKSDNIARMYNPPDCSRPRYYMCEVPIPANHEVQENQITQISIN